MICSKHLLPWGLHQCYHLWSLLHNNLVYFKLPTYNKKLFEFIVRSNKCKVNKCLLEAWNLTSFSKLNYSLAYWFSEIPFLTKITSLVETRISEMVIQLKLCLFIFHAGQVCQSPALGQIHTLYNLVSVWSVGNLKILEIFVLF